MSNEVATANPFGQSVGASRTAGNAVAQADQHRAVAEVQAAMMIARINPRDPVRAMDSILNACTRPTLANAAIYEYAKGGQSVTGPSIRLAEAIAQQWGNIHFGFREMSRGLDFDGVTYSEIEAFAWDMETGTKRPLQFRVRHWIDTKGGGRKCRDEREIYELTANMAQRRVRSCLLAVIPGDVTEAAVAQCNVTMRASADTSPEAMKKMVEAFAQFGVTKDQIEKRIQRRLDAIQPAQVVSLKSVYASLRDGMSVASDWFDEIESGAGEKKVSAAEALKAKAKQGEPAEIEHQPAADPIPQQTRQAEREPVQQGRNPPPASASQQSAEQWIPTDEELAEIAARERAEAGGQSEQRQAAPAGRRQRGQMSLD